MWLGMSGILGVNPDRGKGTAILKIEDIPNTASRVIFTQSVEECFFKEQK
jgi:hypothetical protein